MTEELDPLGLRVLDECQKKGHTPCGIKGKKSTFTQTSVGPFSGMSRAHTASKRLENVVHTAGLEPAYGFLKGLQRERW